MTRRPKYSLIALSLVALFFGSTSCEDIDNENLQGNWYNTFKYFPGTPRGGAVCFTIELDGKPCAFVGTGANTNKTEEQERFRDFYMATPNDSTGLPVWTARYDKLYSTSDTSRASITAPYHKEDAKYYQAVCSMPTDSEAIAMGVKAGCHARNGAVGFSINGKGYVGLGYDGTNFLKDFWCYDPETNKWSLAPEYPGDACRYACSFVIDNIAYVGGGEDYDQNILGDFYKFDGNTWTQIKTIGVPRSQATAFTCNGKGYVFGGINGSAITAFQCYNPETEDWEDLRMLKNYTRDSFDDQYVNLASYGSTSFVVYDNTPDCRAYVTTGGASGVSTLTWEYNPFYDYWVQKTSFEGAARKFAVSFVFDNTDFGSGYGPISRGFVTTGSTSDMSITGQSAAFYADTYMFQPQAPKEILDN
ncbi:MAG: Kelch repeat-containing protein [Marinilabiliaceae bacterium]|nr:hypothetical protein [Bacteroidales bacterium]MDY4521935.1 kelch repeat-containing protein [Bacteroidales bacterium]